MPFMVLSFVKGCSKRHRVNFYPLLCFLILGFKLSNWKGTWGSFDYIQRWKKRGSGQFGSMYSLYPTNTSERASFTNVPHLYVETYFPFPAQIPPVFHFWTYFLLPKEIWPITPWLNHKTELQTVRCREHSGFPRILTCGPVCCVFWRAYPKKNNLNLLFTCGQMSGWNIFLERINSKGNVEALGVTAGPLAVVHVLPWFWVGMIYVTVWE